MSCEIPFSKYYLEKNSFIFSNKKMISKNVSVIFVTILVMMIEFQSGVLLGESRALDHQLAAT